MIARTRTIRPLVTLAVAIAAALALTAPGAALAAANAQNTATPSAPTTSTALAAGAAASPLGTVVGAAATTQNKGGGRISTGVAIIAGLAALLALGAVAWALARRFAYEPRWWLGLRHSFAEASFRTSATWAELRDWARIGR